MFPVRYYMYVVCMQQTRRRTTPASCGFPFRVFVFACSGTVRSWYNHVTDRTYYFSICVELFVCIRPLVYISVPCLCVCVRPPRSVGRHDLEGAVTTL